MRLLALSIIFFISDTFAVDAIDLCHKLCNPCMVSTELEVYQGTEKTIQVVEGKNPNIPKSCFEGENNCCGPMNAPKDEKPSQLTCTQHPRLSGVIECNGKKYKLMSNEDLLIEGVKQGIDKGKQGPGLLDNDEEKFNFEERREAQPIEPSTIEGLEPNPSGEVERFNK